MSEYQVSQRDLHSSLGDIIQRTRDLDAVIALRLDIARQGEEQAERVLKDLQVDLAKRKDAYESAKGSRIYWEGEQAKLEFRRAAEDHATQEGKRQVFHNDEGTVIESDTIAEPEKPEPKLHHSAEFILSLKGANPLHNFIPHYESLRWAGKEAAFQMGLSPEDFELEPLSEWVWDRISGGLKGRAWYNLPSHTTHSSFCDALWARHIQNLSASRES